MARDFVLVHGMSHGAWCWERLEPLLRRHGHRVFAVDLPGHGRRAHERNALRMPRTHVRCLQDKAILPANAAEYAARLGVTPIDLDTAHNPMLSNPEALAKILESV